MTGRRMTWQEILALRDEPWRQPEAKPVELPPHVQAALDAFDADLRDAETRLKALAEAVGLDPAKVRLATPEEAERLNHEHNQRILGDLIRRAQGRGGL